MSNIRKCLVLSYVPCDVGDVGTLYILQYNNDMVSLYGTLKLQSSVLGVY